MSRRDCPAQGKKCIGCGVEGHFRNVCEKAQSKASAVGEESYEEKLTPEHEGESHSSSSFFFATRSANDNEYNHQDFRLDKTPATND